MDKQTKKHLRSIIPHKYVLEGIPVLIEHGMKKSYINSLQEAIHTINPETKEKWFDPDEVGFHLTEHIWKKNLASRGIKDEMGADEKVINHLDSIHNYSDEEHKHLSNYANGSWNLNKTLLKHHLNRTTPPEIISGKEQRDSDHITGHHLNVLDHLTHRNLLSHDTSLISGLGWSPKHQMKKYGTNRLHLPAYTSTSLDAHTAMSFSKENFGKNRWPKGEDTHHHHIIFHMPKDSPAAWISGAKGHDMHEREFLLPRKTTIDLHPVPDTYKTEGGSHYHFWHTRNIKFHNNTQKQGGHQ